MNILAIVMGIFAGCCTGVQGGVNAQLTRHWAKNPVLATAVSFAVGTAALLALVLLLGIPVPPLTGTTLWWHWIGGLLGAYFVFSLAYLSPRVGASMVVALILAGQILAAVVLDHFGLAGYPERPVTLLRLCGLASLACGVVLIRRS